MYYFFSLLSQARDFYELTEGTEWIKFLEADSSGRFQVLRVSVRKVVSFSKMAFLNEFNFGMHMTPILPSHRHLSQMTADLVK
jgi:hypothetical protein